MDLKYEKVHTTAVVIIPPENLWPSIQAIRVKYDKAYSRWMPHINLVSASIFCFYPLKSVIN